MRKLCEFLVRRSLTKAHGKFRLRLKLPVLDLRIVESLFDNAARIPFGFLNSLSMNSDIFLIVGFINKAVPGKVGCSIAWRIRPLTSPTCSAKG